MSTSMLMSLEELAGAWQGAEELRVSQNPKPKWGAKELPQVSKRILAFVCSVGDFLRILPWYSSPNYSPPFVPGSKLPSFPYNRGWSSTQ